MNIIQVINKLEQFRQREGATQEQIRHAEETLGLTFAPDYKEYLAQFGSITARGMELTGIGAKHIDVVKYTQYARDISDTFPDNLYVVNDLGIDSIVIVQSATGEIYETAPNHIPKKIFDSLAEYIEKDIIENDYIENEDE